MIINEHFKFVLKIKELIIKLKLRIQKSNHKSNKQIKHKIFATICIVPQKFYSYEMSLFTNYSFISQIIKHQGAADYFDSNSLPILQALIQGQTRKMVQTASKFMHNDRRDHLTPQDIQNAIKQLGHDDLLHIMSQKSQYKHQTNHYLLQDPIYKDITSFIQQEMKSLQPISMPTLRGRYIYINKRIPKTNENHQLKSLEDIKQIKMHQDQEKKRNFNIIRDQPQAQLTKQEIDYYNQIVGYLTNNVGTATVGNGKDITQNGSESTSTYTKIQVKGYIVNVLPLIIKFIINLGVNENCIEFLLKSLQNKYVWSSLQYNLHQILVVMMAYEGEKCLEVGIKIGSIVNRFGQKYPNLYDIFEQVENSCPSITKKIGFQIVTGIPLKLSYQELKKIQHRATLNDTEASMCMKALLDNWSGLECLREKRICQEYGYVYWFGCKELQNDPYMSMC